MSYGLPDYIKKRIDEEHHFNNDGICSICGQRREKVQAWWRRGLADMVECKPIQSDKGGNEE